MLRDSIASVKRRPVTFSINDQMGLAVPNWSAIHGVARRTVLLMNMGPKDNL